MKKIVAIFICFAVIFAFSGCGKNANSFTGWEITEMRVNGDATADALLYYGIFRIATTDGSRKVDEIWVNLYGMEKNQATINLRFANSSTFSNPTDKEFTVEKESLKENNGWVKICDNQTDIEFSYVDIYVTETMTFNEIVFINVNNSKLQLTLSEGGIRTHLDRNVASYLYKGDQNELESKIEKGEITSSALNLVDEQKKFDLN